MSVMMWDKNKALQTIMKKRKAGGGEIVAGPAPMNEEVVKDEEGNLDGLHLASQDIMAAFHEKSAEKLNSALKNYLDLYSNQEEESEEEE